MSKVALVVPSLTEEGGVRSVARFVKTCLIASGDFDLRVISLATSARDEVSVRLTRPSTWLRGICSRPGQWEGLPYLHVGCFLSELEFQRYKQRQSLSSALGDCDLIQVVSGSPAWALPVTRLNKPVVLQVATRSVIERRARERSEHGLKGWWRWAMTRVSDRLDDQAIREVDAVLVENEWMLRYASDVASQHGTWVRYAPPGVDTELFHPPVESSRTPDSSYVLSVGRFDDPRKNVGLLLDSFARMVEMVANPPALKLTGSGDPGRAFWNDVRGRGLEKWVTFHSKPSLKELIAYYQNALCLVLSSHEEGFGMVLVEAMACGVPAIATRCGGPDGIITDGIDGYLVPIGDPAAMADRLQLLSDHSHLRNKMGEAARKTVEARFAQEVAATIYLDTYRKLISPENLPREF